nr:hypothetical protein [Tanacetum cinerariifolium]
MLQQSFQTRVLQRIARLTKTCFSIHDQRFWQLCEGKLACFTAKWVKMGFTAMAIGMLGAKMGLFGGRNGCEIGG